MVQERHSYNTRNSVLFLVLLRVNSSGDKSFSYIAALLISGTSYQSPFEQLKTLYIFNHQKKTLYVIGKNSRRNHLYLASYLFSNGW